MFKVTTTSTSINKTIWVLFSALVLASSLVLITPPAAYSDEHEPTGTSQADLPNYRAAFSIENDTGVTIEYQARWGKRNSWKSMTLPSGSVMKHTYPLGENPTAKVPAPYVRFNDDNGTPKEYHLDFYAIGYAGFGPETNDTQPKQYFFEYDADGRNLDLFAR